MHPMLNMAVKAARSAGQIIMRHLNQLDRLTVESKGRKDFVTEVDRMAENEIIRILHAAYPKCGKPWRKLVVPSSGSMIHT